MSYDKYQSIQITVEGSAAWLTIDHAPLNVLDAVLMPELNDFADKVAMDESIDVIVFQSADSDFFILHGDMNFVNEPESLMNLELGDPGTEHLNPMMRLNEKIRALPQLTIGKLAGLVRGGGAELFSTFDMRFAARGKAGLAQMEVLIGIIPGAGGMAYLPQLVGRSRALEIALGAELFDADMAEKYGWINRALPADQLDNFVDNLARNIAASAPGVVKAAKKAIGTPDLSTALTLNNELLGQTFSAPEAIRLSLLALEKGAQTRNVEKDIEHVLKRV